MASTRRKVIATRLGDREGDMDKVIHFPRGLVGFEHLRDFTILQIREGAALLVLQSMDEPGFGLLVADPFAFISDYSLQIGEADQRLLQAEDAADLAVLVTASIPPGKPEETALNLVGPIFINHRARLGLQIPQVESSLPGKLFVPISELGKKDPA